MRNDGVAKENTDMMDLHIIILRDANVYRHNYTLLFGLFGLDSAYEI